MTFSKESYYLGIVLSIHLCASVLPVPILGYLGIINLLLFVAGVPILRERILLLLPIYLFMPIGYGGVPLFSLTIIVSIAMLLVRGGGVRSVIADLSPLVCAMFLWAWSTLSLLHSDDPFLALRYYGPYTKAVLVAGLVALLVRRDDLRESILGFSALVSAFALLVKIAYGANIEIISAVANPLAVETAGKINIYHDGGVVARMTFIGQDPNYAAANQMVGLACAGWVMAKSQSGSAFLRGLGSVAANYVQILGTFSRSAFIAATGALILMGRLSARWLLLTIAVSSGALLYVLSNDALVARISSIASDTTGGSNRTWFWHTAIEMWSENILFGAGLGSYSVRVRDAAHSTYLQTLAEQGLVGLILLLLSMVVVFLSGAGGYRSKDWKVGAAVFVGFCALLQTVTYFDVDVLLFSVAIIGLSCRRKNGACI